MSKATVLIIEDEPDMLENCRRILGRAGYDCLLESDSTRVRDQLAEMSPDVILTDLVMPGSDGMAILSTVKSFDPELPVIVFTAYAAVESAVEAIRKGAFDYISKPFTSGQLVVAVDRAVHQRRLLRENRRLSLLVSETLEKENIIGMSEPMESLHRVIQKIAEGDASVLITGESGTGKELVAKAIHLRSGRREAAFVPVDCVALPDTLLEAELFGHEKGAFTGAHLSKPGLLEIAHKGTLFLDEISRLSPATQAKLLRVLQEREFRRLGSNRVIRVNFRVLSATNDDLGKMIAEGRFREDLYYRLNVIHIHLPTLRERRGDLPLLAAHFLRKYRSEAPHIRGIADQTLQVLETHSWPGNVREFENAVRRAMVLAEGNYLTPKDFPFLQTVSAARPDGNEPGDDIMGLSYKEGREKAIEGFEKRYLLRLLRHHSGHISAAAESAGIDRRTIHRLIKKHGLDPKSIFKHSEC